MSAHIWSGIILTLIKAAASNNLVITMDQMIVLNVKGVAFRDKPTEKCHSNLQLL